MSSSLRSYALVTGAYWADTIADGASRVIVLFYFYERGFSPLAVASLFLFYEIFGIVTNLFGGWLAARFGLRSTLVAGLSTQVVALGLGWSVLPAAVAEEDVAAGRAVRGDQVAERTLLGVRRVGAPPDARVQAFLRLALALPEAGRTPIEA